MRIMLVGFGSVGRAVASMLEERRGDLYARMGLAPRLVGVADSRGVAINPAGLIASELFKAKDTLGSVGLMPGLGQGNTDVARAIRELPADVLIEASPSALANPGPAFEHMKAAFASGKHVVSVNKAPLALAMPALLELARFNNVQFRYSGTVGAGTPVLATARTLIAGDRVTSIRAILNGTTNFILWRMSEHDETYQSALAEAIRLGYAETDPSADVDGLDTATKVVIIANAVLGMNATVGDVRITGIRDIPREIVEKAKSAGRSIKLVGSIEVGVSGGLSVRPIEVPRFGPMDVPANLNAVQFALERAGEVTLVGRGAGGAETATAIVRDLVETWNSVPHA